MMSGHYKLGFRKLLVYHNVYKLMMLIEKIHRIDYSNAANLKYNFQTYDVAGNASMGDPHRKFLTYAVSTITDSAAITFTQKDGKTVRHLSTKDKLDNETFLSGTLVSGADRIPIYRNVHKALCFMEYHLGLSFEG